MITVEQPKHAFDLEVWLLGFGREPNPQRLLTFGSDRVPLARACTRRHIYDRRPAEVDKLLLLPIQVAS